MAINEIEDNGSSLIEVVVVISILSILSSIALSIFNTYKEKAADTLVKVSMINSFKECKTSIFLNKGNLSS